MSNDNTSRPNSIAKRLFAPLFVFVLLLGVFFTIQQVQRQQQLKSGAYPNGADLHLQAPTSNVHEGDTFTVDISMNTNEMNVSSADITVKYPSDTLEVQSIEVPNTYLMPYKNSQSIQAGRTQFFVNITNLSNPLAKQTTGLVATLRVRALKPTASGSPARMEFDSATKVAAIGKQGTNVVNLMDPANIVVLPAQQTASLSLQADKTTVQSGDEVTLNAFVNTNDLRVTIAQLHITYPADAFDFVSFTSGSFLPSVYQPATNTPGNATIGVSLADLNSLQSGTGTMAVLKLRAKQFSGAARIAYATDTKVAAAGARDRNVAGPNPGSVDITYGAAPTPTTPPPTPTFGLKTFRISAKVPGIGTDPGDNTNPLHRTRPVEVVLLGKDGNSSTVNGTLTFDGVNFSGNIDMTSTADGDYDAKIRIPFSLFKHIPGVTEVKAGVVTLPTVAMVMGDFVNSDTGAVGPDNILDLLDYNYFIYCFQNNNCTPEQIAARDVNDDGEVFIVDANIQKRAFRDRIGD